MAIDRNTLVDIPSIAYVGKDGSVYVKDKNVYDPVKRYNIVKHTVIGRSVGKGRMYPNNNYKVRYPALYEQFSGQKLKRHTLKAGLYVATLAIAQRCGLYDALIKSFGIENANMILDFSMYSIVYQTCVSEQYAASMQDHMVFSRTLWSPSRLSTFFSSEFPEPRISEFKRLWSGWCMKDNVRDVWLAIDGSNNDCRIEDSSLCEMGHSKSGKDVHIVSYLYAVDAVTGRPVTMAVNRGGMVDCKAVLGLVGWLKAYNMEVKGAIIDRGFATEDVFTSLDGNGISYVAMLKGNAFAHKEMLKINADRIRMKYSYMLGKYETGCAEASVRTSKDAPMLYGIRSEEPMKLFFQSTYSAYAHLIYDRQNGGQRQEAWYRKITDTARSLQRALSNGKEIAIPNEFKDCLSKVELNGRDVILVNEAEVQAVGDRKGYYTLASSKEMTTTEACRLYSLRNSSEEQYSLLKSQMGGDVTGVHSDEGVTAKLFISFVASILRNELVNMAKECDVPTNRMVKELNHICINTDFNDRYFVCHTENARQVAFLRWCGVKPDVLDGIAQMANLRKDSVEPDPIHILPEGYEIKERPGHGGRAKGSKNLQPKKEKKSGNVEAMAEKRGPGRPKGAKNKKTLERERLQAAARRSPGRPKGSRNKPKPAEQPVKKKRGRPKKEN